MVGVVRHVDEEEEAGTEEEGMIVEDMEATDLHLVGGAIAEAIGDVQGDTRHTNS